jgi:hypothetical protein
MMAATLGLACQGMRSGRVKFLIAASHRARFGYYSQRIAGFFTSNAKHGTMCAWERKHSKNSATRTENTHGG